METVKELRIDSMVHGLFLLWIVNVCWPEKEDKFKKCLGCWMAESEFQT